MQKIVLDTNVLVSALLSPFGAPARVLDLLLNGYVQLCYDSRIIAEYREVLLRPKFGFNKQDIDAMLDFLLLKGLSVTPEPLSLQITDEDDRAFFEVAYHTQGYLVTGNSRHFPKDRLIVSPACLLELLSLP